MTGQASFMGAVVDLADEVLARFIPGVGLPGKYKLDRPAACAMHNSFETGGIVENKGSPFIGGKTAGKPNR